MWQTKQDCQMDIESYWPDFIKHEASQMMRLKWNLNLITTCPTYGQILLMEQWIFLKICEHLAHQARTLTTLSIWQQDMPPYLIVWYHTPYFWHGILSLPGCQYSPPPSVVGSAMLHPRHHPLFVSLRFSLARRQCPSLGTKCWREPHKRNNLSLFPSQSSPVFRRSSWTNANL